MTALAKMLADTQRLKERHELRLEQYRIAFTSGSSDQAAMLRMRQHERALRKLRALQADIRQSILAEQPPLG